MNSRWSLPSNALVGVGNDKGLKCSLIKMLQLLYKNLDFVKRMVYKTSPLKIKYRTPCSNKQFGL